MSRTPDMYSYEKNESVRKLNAEVLPINVWGCADILPVYYLQLLSKGK